MTETVSYDISAIKHQLVPISVIVIMTSFYYQNALKKLKTLFKFNLSHISFLNKFYSYCVKGVVPITQICTCVMKSIHIQVTHL